MASVLGIYIQRFCETRVCMVEYQGVVKLLHVAYIFQIGLFQYNQQAHLVKENLWVYNIYISVDI